MKIVDKRTGDKVIETLVKEIAIGTVFSGKITHDHNSIYLRIWEGIVDLKRPNHTWNIVEMERNCPKAPPLKVEKFTALDATLMINGIL